MESLKKSVLDQQQTSIRSLTVYFSDQLSNIQAHYLATVIVSTLSEAILFIIACSIYFGMRALPMYIYSDYEAMARHHATVTMQFEEKMGILVEKSWQVRCDPGVCVTLVPTLCIFLGRNDPQY